MKREKGITLIALVITIIVLLILAGIALNTIVGENGIFNTSTIAVEEYKKSQVKEKIEYNILEKLAEKKAPVTMNEIIDKLIEKGITTEANSDREGGILITEEGYVATIIDKGNGAYEVIIGNEAKISLSTSIEPDILTDKTNIKIKGCLLKKGIKELILPNGEKKEYEVGVIKIEESYEVTENGKYTIVLVGNDGQKIDKEVEITNIVEGAITINPSTNKWTKENIKIEVIYPEGTESLIREISIDGGKNWQEYKEPIEITENTTIKARLKNDIGEIKTATLEITNIEKTPPIVVAKQESVTITSGESYETSSYFEINQNGNAPIISTKYSVDNTSSLGVGTHTITCTVTKENGMTASASITVIVNKLEYAKVSYTTPGTYTWTVPAGVTRVKVTVAGAGGGGHATTKRLGSSGTSKGFATKNTGGSGEQLSKILTVQNNQTVQIVVGGGGVSAIGKDSVGSSGGSSSILEITAKGGGRAAYNTNGVSAGNGQGGAGGTVKKVSSSTFSKISGGNGWVYIEYGGDI